MGLASLRRKPRLPIRAGIFPTFARQAPVDLPQDPGKAARVAETDLARRAEEYIEAYRAAKAQGKEAW